MAQLIDGKDFASKLRLQITQEVAQLREQGITPGLAVVLVGEDPASQVYVRNKGIQTTEAGMASFTHKLADTTSEEALLALIDSLNADSRVNGILVQMPLPKNINAATIINAIAPSKDVDGFHPLNVGRLSTGGNATIPCTPLGCLMLLKDRLGDLSGLNALVLGRSNIVGKPMSMLLLNEHCTVTTAHSRTRNLEQQCRRADILIAAVGRPEMVKGSWIKPGAIVIDVGINRLELASGKTRLVGDVDFSSASERAAAITPVPGGVGPMTIACLLLNTLSATLHQNGLPIPKWIPTPN